MTGMQLGCHLHPWPLAVMVTTTMEETMEDTMEDMVGVPLVEHAFRRSSGARYGLMMVVRYVPMMARYVPMMARYVPIGHSWSYVALICFGAPRCFTGSIET